MRVEIQYRYWHLVEELEPMENGEGGRVCYSGNVTPVDRLISSSSRWKIGSDSEMEEVNENVEEGENCGVNLLLEERSELMQDLSDSLQDSEAEAPKFEPLKKLASRRHTLHSMKMAAVDVPCCGGCSVPASPRVSALGGRLSMPIIQRKSVTRSASFDQGCQSETHGWMSLKVNVV